MPNQSKSYLFWSSSLEYSRVLLPLLPGVLSSELEGSFLNVKYQYLEPFNYVQTNY